MSQIKDQKGNMAPSKRRLSRVVLLPLPILAASCGLGANTAPRDDNRAGILVDVAAWRPSAPRPASTDVGETAGAVFSLRDVVSGLQIRARLIGARNDVAREPTNELLVFRQAYFGGDVIRKTDSGSIEDFFRFERPSAKGLEYVVELGEGVAGLRLVSNTLEFLDERGAPRLRVAPPWLLDERGSYREVALTVADCAADTDPRPPWGRAITRVDKQSCHVRLSWDELCPSFPTFVDPLWETTGQMMFPRMDHAATTLSDGRVLVAGGFYIMGPQIVVPKQTELFDPASGTWSVTGSLGLAREAASAALLTSGNVLVAGGTVTATAEVYNVGAGTWSPTGNMMAAQTGTLTRLPSGDVLLCGGNEGTDPKPIARCQVYKPGTNQWGAVPWLSNARRYHTATALQDGRVLVAGGLGANSTTLTSTELFTEGASWVDVPPMLLPRSNHAAVLLADGEHVLVAGGQHQSGPTATSALFSVVTSQWSFGPSLDVERTDMTGSLLANGCVLLAGGGTSVTSMASQLYDPVMMTWLNAPQLPLERTRHTASAVNEGILIAGGMVASNGQATNDAQVFRLGKKGEVCANNCDCAGGQCVNLVCCEGVDPPGTPCTDSCSCASGSCVDGVCCSTPCDGPCEQCGSNGVCAPVPAGEDPAGDCDDEGAASCGRDGMCDGNGACRLYAPGTECGLNGCDNAEVRSATCNGAGQCLTNSTSCEPYLCDSNTNTCFSECESIDQCSSPNVCTKQGDCTPPPNQPAEFGGCGCRVPTDGGHRGVASLLAFLVCALRLRRSRKSGHRDKAVKR